MKKLNRNKTLQILKTENGFHPSGGWNPFYMCQDCRLLRSDKNQILLFRYNYIRKLNIQRRHYMSLCLWL